MENYLFGNAPIVKFILEIFLRRIEFFISEEKKYICIYPFIYHDMEKGILQCLSLNISEERLKELGLNGIIKINW